MLKKTIIFCFSLLLLIPSSINAQSTALFTSPIMLSEIVESNVDTDGAKTIAVYNENVYAVWIDWDKYNICFAKSTDRGQNFSKPIYPSSIPDSTLSQLFPSITVDENGYIYITWTGITDDLLSNPGIYMVKSTDGGESFEDTKNIVPESSVYSSIATYENNVYVFYATTQDYPLGDYFFRRSLDNGENFSEAIQINDEACQDSVKFDSMTDMIVDKDGVIHLAWNDSRRAIGNSDIYYCKSTDNGQSFSANIPVNDLSSAAANKLHWDPSIGIKQNGDIIIAWRYHEEFRASDNWDYTNRIAFKNHDSDSFTNQNYINFNLQHCSTPSIAINDYDQVYLTFSATRLYCYSMDTSDETFTQQTINENNITHGATTYPSIVIDNENKACILWTDETDIYFARGGYETPITIDSEHTTINSFSLHQNYPNPFNPTTMITYDLSDRGEVNLSIYNIHGELVQTLVNETQNIGQYKINWNATDYPSGIYFYKLETNNFSSMKKMMLVK